MRVGGVRARWLAAVVGGACVLGVGLAGPVLAAQSGGIGLTPNVLSVYLKHGGERATRRITLYNMYNVPVTYRVIRTGVTYSAKNEPEFNGSNQKSYAWLRAPQAPVSIPAHGSHVFVIAVQPARSLTRGELYGALLFVPVEAKAGASGTTGGSRSTVGIGLSAQVGVQVGPVGHVALSLVGRPLPWAVWGASPSETLIRLHNTGTGFASPLATLDVNEGGRLVSRSKAVLGYVVPGATASMWVKIAVLPVGIGHATVTVTAPGMKPVVWHGWLVRVPTSTVVAVIGAVALVELTAWLRGRLGRPRRAVTYGEFQKARAR